MADNLATVLNSEIDSTLGRLPDVAEVNTAVKHTLGI